MIDKEKYELTQGPIDSPEKLTAFYIATGRQSGKTTALLQSLPEDTHCVVLVHRLDMAQHLKRELRVLRPLFNQEYICWASTENLSTVLRGRKEMPIFIDNAVLDVLQTKYTKKINEWWGVWDEVFS